MKRTNSQPIDLRAFECPQCHKRRNMRSLTHVVSRESQEYKTRDGSKIVLFTDICDFCKTRNFQKYFEPSKADIRKLIKSIQSDAKLEGDKSLEDLL